MKRIVVLGNSIAGIKAIEEIRKQDPSVKITLLTLEERLPYYRHLLADLVSKDISNDQIFYQPKDYYERLQVDVSEEKITRVNFKRNRITTEDKQHIDYDWLMITDTGTNKFPDIKGTNKTGVFSLRQLSDIDQFIGELPLTETAVVMGGGRPGFKMACAIRKREKEVLWIVPPHASVPLEETDIRILKDNTITELLGDSEVKAVRLKSGKVMAAEAVVFGDTPIDLKLFKDTGLQFKARISVNEHFQTNFDNVFALNGICDSVQNQNLEGEDGYLSVLEEQGSAVAAYLAQTENSNVSLPASAQAADENRQDLPV